MSADGMFRGPRLLGSSLMRIFPRNFWKDLRRNVAQKTLKKILDKNRRKVVIVLADNLACL